MLRFTYKDKTLMLDSFEAAYTHLILDDPDWKDGVWVEVSQTPLSPLHPQTIVTDYKWVEGNFFD
jgi:hypothetical protein